MSEAVNKIIKLMEQHLDSENYVQRYEEILTQIPNWDEKLISEVIDFYSLKARRNRRKLVEKFIQCDDEEKRKFEIIIDKLQKVNEADEKYCASALVALYNPDEPIYSNNIKKALGIKSEALLLTKVREFYFEDESDDVKKFKENCKEAFDKKYAKYKDSVSDVKKIDFVLWAIGLVPGHTWRDYV